MARKQAAAIAGALIAAGRDGQEPAAIIANAARPDQQVTVTTLAELGHAAEQSPPVSVIVIGANVRLRQELDWLTRLAAGLNPALS
jgi:uroporphyrin-III C-methyltransferase